MIEVIIYFFLLTLYFKLPDFNKFRSTTSALFNIMLTIISIAIFLYSCIKIVSDPFYVFNNDLTNLNLRYTALLIYIVTFVTLFGFTLSHYYIKVSRVKKGKGGEKGIRGNRGTQGTDKTCNPRQCTEEICYPKLLRHCTQTYMDILKKKNIINVGGFENKYLKNKLKLLCKSKQFQEMIKKQGSSKAYLYVQDIWSQWINIILKYEKGQMFIENENLTDNDFNNLIGRSDKLYSEFDDITNPGTPTRGKESPFDEMKKFDMYYWGENVKGMPKIIYKCMAKNKDALELYRSSIDKNIFMWESKNARQAKVKKELTTGGEKVCRETYVPFLRKGNADININRVATETLDKKTFFPGGDVIGNTSTKLYGGDVKHPIGYDPVHLSERTEGEGVGLKGFSIWRPKCPTGYKSLGLVVDNTPSMTPPDLETVVCVPETCVRKKASKNVSKLWENKSDPYIGCDGSYGTQDTDNGAALTLWTSNDEHLFETDPNKLLEVIPKGENGSCIGENEKKSSKWVVSEKNDDKYSIFNIYNDV